MGAFEDFVNANLGVRMPLFIDTTTPSLSSKAAGSLGSKFVDSTTNFLYEKTGFTNADWVKIAELGDSRGGGGGSINLSGGYNIDIDEAGSTYTINLSEPITGTFRVQDSEIIGTGSGIPFGVSESGQVGLNLFTGENQLTGFVTPYHLHVSGVTALSGAQDLNFATKPALTVFGNSEIEDGGLYPASMTTAERNALSLLRGGSGALIYNSDSNQLEINNGSTWRTLSGGALGSGVGAVANIGAGSGIASGVVDDTAFFKSLIGGTNLQITGDGESLYLNVTGVSGSTVSGITGASNIGDGSGILSGISDNDLVFRTIEAGPNVNITESNSGLKISATTSAYVSGGSVSGGVGSNPLISGYSNFYTTLPDEIILQSAAPDGSPPIPYTLNFFDAVPYIFYENTAAGSYSIARFDNDSVGSNGVFLGTSYFPNPLGSLSGLIGSGKGVYLGGGGSGSSSSTTGITGATNLGAGSGLISGITSNDLQVKSLVGGTNLQITGDGESLYLNVTGVSGSTVSGITGASNIGDGSGILSGIADNDLVFRTIKAGPNVTISESSSGLLIGANTTNVTVTGGNVSGGIGSNAFVSGASNFYKFLPDGLVHIADNRVYNLVFEFIDTGSSYTATAVRYKDAQSAGTNDRILSFRNDSDGSNAATSLGGDSSFNAAGPNFSTLSGYVASGRAVYLGGGGSGSSSSSTTGITGASNIGTGSGVFSGISDNDLVFRTIEAGPNVSITESYSGLKISASTTNVTVTGGSVSGGLGSNPFVTGESSFYTLLPDEIVLNAQAPYPDAAVPFRLHYVGPTIYYTQQGNEKSIIFNNDSVGSFSSYSNTSAAEWGAGQSISGYIADGRAVYLGAGGSGSSSSTTGITGVESLGAGSELASGVSGSDLYLKSLVGGTNVTLSSDDNTITINASAGGGGGGGSSAGTVLAWGVFSGTEGAGALTVQGGYNISGITRVDDGRYKVDLENELDYDFYSVSVSCNPEGSQGAYGGVSINPSLTPPEFPPSTSGFSLQLRDRDGNYVNSDRVSFAVIGSGSGAGGSSVSGITGASNIGTGSGVFSGISDNDLVFRTIQAGPNVTIDEVGSGLRITASTTNVTVTGGSVSGGIGSNPFVTGQSNFYTELPDSLALTFLPSSAVTPFALNRVESNYIYYQLEYYSYSDPVVIRFDNDSAGTFDQFFNTSSYGVGQSLSGYISSGRGVYLGGAGSGLGGSGITGVESLGAGSELASGVSGSDLYLKSLVGGTNVTLSSDDNTITINASAGGGGGGGGGDACGESGIGPASMSGIADRSNFSGRLPDVIYSVYSTNNWRMALPFAEIEQPGAADDRIYYRPVYAANTNYLEFENDASGTHISNPGFNDLLDGDGNHFNLAQYISSGYAAFYNSGCGGGGGGAGSSNVQSVYTGDGTALQFIDLGFTPDMVQIQGPDNTSAGFKNPNAIMYRSRSGVSWSYTHGLTDLDHEAYQNVSTRGGITGNGFVVPQPDGFNNSSIVYSYMAFGSGGGGGSSSSSTTGITGATNLGAGSGLISGITSNDLQVKSLVGGTNLQITGDGESLYLNVTGVSGSTVSGITGASNIGSGSGILSGISDNDLVFRTIEAGPNVSITESSSGLKIAASTTNVTVTGGTVSGGLGSNPFITGESNYYSTLPDQIVLTYQSAGQKQVFDLYQVETSYIYYKYISTDSRYIRFNNDTTASFSTFVGTNDYGAGQSVSGYVASGRGVYLGGGSGSSSSTTGITGATNLGAGSGLISGITDNDLQVKSLVGGTNLQITGDGESLYLNVTGVSNNVSGGAGSNPLVSGESDFYKLLPDALLHIADDRTYNLVFQFISTGVSDAASAIRYTEGRQGGNRTLSFRNDSTGSDADAIGGDASFNAAGPNFSTLSGYIASGRALYFGGGGSGSSSSTAGITGASNLGTGSGILSGISDNDLVFRTIEAGPNVTIDEVGSGLRITASTTNVTVTGGTVSGGLGSNPFITGASNFYTTLPDQVILSAVSNNAPDAFSLYFVSPTLIYYHTPSISSDAFIVFDNNSAATFDSYVNTSASDFGAGQSLSGYISSGRGVYLGGGGSGSSSSTTGITGVESLGAGSELASGVSGSDLYLKSLVGGTNVTLSSDDNTITINASAGGGGGGAGSGAGNGPGKSSYYTGVSNFYSDLPDWVAVKAGQSDPLYILYLSAFDGGSEFRYGFTADSAATYYFYSFDNDAAGTFSSSSRWAGGAVSAESPSLSGLLASGRAGYMGGGSGSSSSTTGITGATNIGTGSGVFSGISDNDLVFRTIEAGPNVFITESSSGLKISSTTTNVTVTGGSVSGGLGSNPFVTGISNVYTVLPDQIVLENAGGSAVAYGLDTISPSYIYYLFDEKYLKFNNNAAGSFDSNGWSSHTPQLSISGYIASGRAVYLGGGGSGSSSSTTGITGVESLGAGSALASGVSGSDLYLKSLVGGTNVTLSSDENTITINASAGGGGGGSSSSGECSRAVIHLQSDIEEDFTTGIYDKSIQNNTVTIDGVTNSTTQVHRGNSSIYFDGTSTNHLLVPENYPIYKSTNATIESWIYWDPTDVDGALVSHATSNPLSDGDYVINFSNNDSLLNIAFGGDNGYNFSIPSIGIPTQEWFHFAFCNYSGVQKLYINGSGNSFPAAAAGGNWGTAGSVYIGNYTSNSVYDFEGYLQDFRITRGECVYTGDFTPPAALLSTACGGGGAGSSSSGITNSVVTSSSSFSGTLPNAVLVSGEGGASTSFFAASYVGTAGAYLMYGAQINSSLNVRVDFNHDASGSWNNDVNCTTPYSSLQEMIDSGYALYY